MTDTAQLPVVCLAGPTGAGKTAAALALAKAFPASVINTDSRQVYSDFPIITAQPTVEEQHHCPHYLYGFLSIQSPFGAGEYIRHSAPVITTVYNQGHIPLLVGGTGLYFKTLLQGVASIPSVDEEIKKIWLDRCAEKGPQALHAVLQSIDPDYAAKIHPNDKQRIVRALEVWQGTGNTFTWWHNQPLPPSPYRPCIIGVRLSLQELEPLLKKRIDLMLEAGAIEEAKAAMEKSTDPFAPGWSGIGCQELFLYLSASISLDQCRDLWLKNTRAYAKRQLTWFNASPGIMWVPPSATDTIIATVANFLSKNTSKIKTPPTRNALYTFFNSNILHSQDKAP